MVLSIFMLTVLWTWGGNPLSFDASAAQDASPKGKVEAVVIICFNNSPVANPPILVYGSSSSAGAPAVSVGSECAQALASVLTAGFQLSTVTNAFSGVQYTLIK